MNIDTTPHMEANDITLAFNACSERGGWKAIIAGTRAAPLIKFTSPSNMVELFLHMQTSRISFQFTKCACSWGDYLTAVRRGLFAVLTALKASGSPVSTPMSETEGTLRMEYDLAVKATYIWLANLDDDWTEYVDKPFKALEGVL